MLKDKKKDKHFARFLEIFKQMHINIPFLEAIAQMLKYTKFSKEIISNKKKLKDFDLVELNEECFTFKKTLYDLVASINLMPFFVFKTCKQDYSSPGRVIKDVLVEVNKFIFLLDFMVLNMVEDEKDPIILGHPFLYTGRTLIDVKKGMLTLRLGEEEVVFKVFDSKKPIYHGLL
ncbi:hypothetical protein CR513_38747, partial [Mucuna pruriens]